MSCTDAAGRKRWGRGEVDIMNDMFLLAALAVKHGRRNSYDRMQADPVRPCWTAADRGGA